MLEATLWSNIAFCSDAICYVSGGQSVSGPSRWLIMNGLGSIWLIAACWENVGGRRRSSSLTFSV